MATMADIDPAVQFVLMKGEPGLRKSTAALSYPLPQYWFSVDKKMESLVIPMQNWGIDPKQISFDDYSDWDTMKMKLKFFQRTKPEYKTIIFDSVTSIGDVTNQQTLSRKSSADEGKVIAGINVNSVEDFNAETAVFQELMAMAKDIHKAWKINIILIAHVIQAEYRDIKGKTHISRTLVTGGRKAAAKIPAYCTEIYHFNMLMNADMKGGRYEVLTRHVGDDFARTSLPLDTEIIFNDDQLYGKYILPAINKLKEKQNPPQK